MNTKARSAAGSLFTYDQSSSGFTSEISTLPSPMNSRVLRIAEFHQNAILVFFRLTVDQSQLLGGR